MARFSHGSNRALPWAVAQKARPMPRVVRLGRAANDNARRPHVPMRLVAIGIAAAAAALAASQWMLG